MAMTRLTVVIIATNGEDIHVEAAGPDDSGNWVGWLTLGDSRRPLINTQPIYDTKQEAIDGMEKLVLWCQKEHAKWMAEAEAKANEAANPVDPGDLN